MTVPPLPSSVPPLTQPAGRPALFELTPGEDAPQARVNAVLYGNSGVGKTTLAASLPWGSERWGEKAVYIAWDAGSEALLSVRPEDRKHLTVVTPRYQTGKSGEKLLNPYKAAHEIATADWASLAPGAKTLIWDGGTRLAEQILRAVANTGATISPSKKEKGEETRLGLGERGDPDYMALPIIPDYGMAQHAVMQWGEFMRQQPMNVIIICVSDYYKPDGGSLDGDTVGGPCLVGTKIIPRFMKDFDNVFRISLEPETVSVPADKPGAPPKFERVLKRVLWTERNGIWEAKIRKPPTAVNALARVELTPDPTAFWRKFDAANIG